MTTQINPADMLERLLQRVEQHETRVRLERRSDEIVKTAHEAPDKASAIVAFDQKYGSGYSAGVRIVTLKLVTISERDQLVLDSETFVPMPRPEHSRNGNDLGNRNPLAPQYDVKDKVFRRTATGEVVPA